MTQRKYYRGSEGPFLFDDADAFPDGTPHGLNVTKAPASAGEVLRFDDIGGGSLVAPESAEYVVVSLAAGLSNERRLQVGSGLTLTDSGAGSDITVDVDLGNIDHDSLLNFVAAEHIDWSVTGAEDVHDDRVAESSVTQHEAAIDHDALTNFVANEHIDWTGAAVDLFTSADVDAENVYAQGYFETDADLTTDTAPNDDTSKKRLSLQKLSSPPTNGAYLAFSNNPGSDTFYLVLEEG